MISAEPTEQKFENDRLSVIVHRKPGSRVEFVITLGAEFIRPAHNEAIKSVAKGVSLPGFRKGKAPSELVEKQFPREVDRRWQEEIASAALQDAEKLTKISPLSRNTRVTFNMHSHSLSEGAKLTISFETEPHIPAIDPKILELQQVEKPVVNDEKIEETIRQIRFFFAKWNLIEDRAVEVDDCVLLDVENIERSPSEKVFSDTRFEVSHKGMANWMYDLVVGRKKGETVEGISSPDPEASETEKTAFQPQKVRLTVKAIEHAELPPVDDEFAKKVGVNTVAELREQVSNILQRQSDAHVQEKLREQIGQQLLEKYPFDLPFTLIEKETNFRMQHLLRDSMFYQQWSRMDEEHRKKTVQSVFDQSQKAVRMFYLCRKITEDANIQVRPQDLAKGPATTLEALLQPSSQYQLSEQKEVQQAEAFSRLLLEKAEDYLIAHATMK